MRGLTLIEVLASVAILSIMFALGTPALTHLIKTNQRDGLSQQLIASFRLARTEAIKRNTRVVICPGTTQSGCAASAEWAKGWLVFSDGDNSHNCRDLNEDRACDDHRGLLLAHISPASSSHLSITATGNLKKRLAFNGLGFAVGYAGTFSICDLTSAIDNRGYVISLAGRVRPTHNNSELNCPD